MTDFKHTVIDSLKGSVQRARIGSPADTKKLATQLAQLHKSGVVYLEGDLGSGKTALARYWLEALGVGERIKSPTYTLVEQYEGRFGEVYHLDLYRLEVAEDYLDLGLDRLAENSLMLIEWPSQAAAVLPKATLTIRMEFAVDCGEQSRVAVLTAQPSRDWQR